MSESWWVKHVEIVKMLICIKIVDVQMLDVFSPLYVMVFKNSSKNIPELWGYGSKSPVCLIKPQLGPPQSFSEQLTVLAEKMFYKQ